MVLFCIVNTLCDCVGQIESMKRKCKGFVASCIPSSFWTEIKGLENLFVDVAHRLGEPCYIYVSL